MKCHYYATLGLLLLNGCIATTSKLRFGGTVLALPKDIEISEFEFVLQDGTNTLTFKGKGLNSKNNPELIKARQAGAAALIDASGRVIGTVGGEAAKALLK
jgi:hypothetical protein